MFGGHKLTVTVERILTLSRIFFLNIIRIQSQFCCEIQESSLRRISDLNAPCIGRVITQNTADEESALRRIIQIHIVGTDSQSVYIIIFYRHLILRKCSCLIRADDGYASQAFHSLKLSHDSVLPGHLLCAERKHDRDDGTESFRNRCNCKRYREQERIPDIISPENADAEKDTAEHKNQNGQLLSELIQIYLKRCSLL